MEPTYDGPEYEPEPEVTRYNLTLGPDKYVPRMRQYNEIMDQISVLQDRASEFARGIPFTPAGQIAWLRRVEPNYSPVQVPSNPRGRVRPGF
jgi:hypothetical protein